MLEYIGRGESILGETDRAHARDLGYAGAKIRERGAHVCAGVLALGITVAPLPVTAGDLANLPGVGSPPPLIPAPTGNFFADWFAVASATQAAQPHWMTPLVTVTPRLEQEFRANFFGQTQGNGTPIDNFGGAKVWSSSPHMILS